MAYPFKLSSNSNITAQLVEGTSSYSVSCNIQNSADRKVKYHEMDIPPMSHSAFLPTALFMFQTTK